jgi:crotonobetainyl-CoA:carnitine CoA-transferase CaiB-like acyl-CoA transferase
MAGPLAGLRVLDLTNTLMGPYATQILADMGADVVKVEAPGGDPVRGLGPFRNPGMGAIFLQVNRGKRSLVLDLKQEAGRDTLLTLAQRADLLVYNMRPQVMARLGIGYEAVAAVKPDIVYAGLFGFGQDGPLAPRPAYDDLIQGASALPSLAVQAGAAAPRYVPLALVDRVVGLYGVGAITAALWHRERTGQGQRLDIPMFETMASFVLADHMGGRLFDPPLGPPGYARLLSRDRRPYATRDGFVCAMIYNDGQWRRFFAAIGRPEVWTNDPRFATISERTRHIDAIYGMVAEILAERGTDECVALLEGADIPVSRLASLEDLIDDSHLAATGFFVEIDHPSEGRLTMPGIPGSFSHSPAAIGGPAPRLGQHGRAVLHEAGLSESDIAGLVAAGVTLDPGA